jgi:hypothetical protein
MFPNKLRGESTPARAAQQVSVWPLLKQRDVTKFPPQVIHLSSEIWNLNVDWILDRIADSIMSSFAGVSMVTGSDVEFGGRRADRASNEPVHEFLIQGYLLELILAIH